MSSTIFDWAEYEAEAADPANQIAFTPAPRQRARRNGWSPGRQALFLFALSRCGSVTRPWLISLPAASLKFARKAPKRVTLATLRASSLYRRHCEERSDAAIQLWIAPICSQ